MASSQFLAAIYNNTKKNRDSAIYFLQKGLAFDPDNPSLKQFLNELQKPVGKPTKGSTNPPGKPTSSVKPAASAIRSSAVRTKIMAVAKA